MSEQGKLFPDLPAPLDSRHWLYHRWTGIKSRCYNSNATGFKYYGGKGVIVSDEWINDFPAFAEWSFRNGAARHLQIDRINGDGNYSPDNCRWVTRAVNQRNRPPKSKWNWSDASRAKYERNRQLENEALEADMAEWGEISARLARLNYGRGMSRDELESLWRSKSRGRVPLAVFLRRVSFGWFRLRDALSIPARSKRFAVDPATVAIAQGESEAATLGDKAQRPAIPRGLVDLPAVDLPRPVYGPGYPADWLAKDNGDA